MPWDLGHHDPARSRATLALTFCIGSFLSLGTLGAAGALRTGPVATGVLVLVPATLVGFTAALRLRQHVTSARFRTGVLLLSCVAALGLVARAFGL
ncbi:hypothetical protein GCM10027418_17250 [Mariniluteicoccus endophyticus]